jgi:hypothetical protein
MAQLLDILKDSLQYWHHVVLILIVGSFLKFGLRLWFDYQIAKLKAPSTYEVEMSYDRKVLKIHTHQKIDLQKVQALANGERTVLLEAPEKERKVA